MKWKKLLYVLMGSTLLLMGYTQLKSTSKVISDTATHVPVLNMERNANSSRLSPPVTYREKSANSASNFTVMMRPNSRAIQALRDKEVNEQISENSRNLPVQKEPHLEIKLQSMPADHHSLGVHYPDHREQTSENTAGYVLADSFWEQQTSGSRNLQNLQCWAGKVNVRVVEPFMEKATVTTHFAPHDPKKAIKFGDFINLSEWNKQSRSLNHSELVSWSNFLQEAPRQIIVVRFQHKSWDDVKKLRGIVSSDPSKYPPPSERYKIGCSTNWPREPSYRFLQQNRFLVVREVCFNFMYGDLLTMDQFIRDVYGEFSPSSVTVAFQQWRGTGSPPRVLISDSDCYNTQIQVNIPPANQLVQHSQRYIDTYLNDGEYIAIMARMEKTKITLRRPGIVHDCFGIITKYWKEMKDKYQIDTFLSIDIGKYGSNSFQTTGDQTDLKSEFEDFFASLYGGTSFTINDWEHTFEEVTGSTEAGYIAMLQKFVVSKAKCVIFVGGGSFQMHALNLYLMNHPNPNTQCIKVVTECTTKNALPLDRLL